jgi:hypothetical protein
MQLRPGYNGFIASVKMAEIMSWILGTRLLVYGTAIFIHM